MRSALEEHLVSGGMGLALVNTVQRAQELYRLFPEGEPLEREGKRVGKRLCPMGRKCFFSTPAFRPTGGRNARIRSWRPSGRVAVGKAEKFSLPPRWRSRVLTWTST